MLKLSFKSLRHDVVCKDNGIPTAIVNVVADKLLSDTMQIEVIENEDNVLKMKSQEIYERLLFKKLEW